MLLPACLYLFGCVSPEANDSPLATDSGFGTTPTDSRAPGDTGTPSSETTDSAPTGTGDTADTPPTWPEGSGGSGGGSGSGSGRVDGVDYAWLVPPCSLSGRPPAVVYSQHGAGGTGAQMVAQWEALAEQECFIVIGQDSASGNGWNFNSDVLGLDALIDEVESLWDVDTSRRYLHGYSAGAHWSYVIGLANSATFSGLGVWAGSLSYAETYDVWPNGTQGPIPVAIGHGTSDGTVPYSQATYAEAQLSGAGWDVDLWTVSGGSHAYDPAHQAVAWAWWESHP